MHQRVITTPVGPLTIVASQAGLAAVLWSADADGARVRLSEPVTAGTNAVLEQAVREIEEYFLGTRREFDVPLAPKGTPFQRTVWEALRAIPYGQTITYGEQARRIGKPHASRAVGAANGRNPLSIVVPCHRVIGKDGSLTGFAAGTEAKAWLLDHERRILAAA